MPEGCIFADKGPAIFIDGDDVEKLLAMCAVVNTRLFGLLVSAQLARTELAQSFEVGLIQQTPIPDLNYGQQSLLSSLCGRAWSLKRTIDTTNETSHAFYLPTALRSRLGDYDPPAIETELAGIQFEIDDVAFDLYGFSDADRAAALAASRSTDEDKSDASEASDDGEDYNDAEALGQTDGLLSWAVGVAFGRFDWRLATGEREAPPEPGPFDPLPAKSPGMLPDGDTPFHAHNGILVEDQGHAHDLPRLIEEVLVHVQADAPGDVRRWLQRDFFPLHLKQYSKSRRKAPIYWQLALPSGRYSAWVYAPTVTPDTFFRLQQDFLAPKIADEIRTLGELSAGGRELSGKERQAAEDQEAFVAELQRMSDEVKRIAPLWKPNLDDGIILTKAPLWRLAGSHKPWQKELRAKWDELCRGDYDWAHIAMHLWPERVVPKCAEDRSLAIAHDLEDVFWLEDSSGKWREREHPTRTIDELVRERSIETVKAALKDLLDAPEPNPSSERGRRKK
jgi:hypothetical protein